MDRQGGVQSSERRFAAYVEPLARALGHADRAAPLKAYCTGLILPGERKSVEPMAARLEPARVQATHQSLHHFVAKADWSDEALLALVRAQVLPEIERHGRILAWVVDDTGFPKKGRHSVGVTRQYCGQIGKQDNCQIAVTLSVASLHASLPIAYRLYLPELWTEDLQRRATAGVPKEVEFQTKPEIALDQIRLALAAGVSPGVILADAGYGVDTAFRTALTDLDLAYLLGIQSSTTLWPLGAHLCRPSRGAGEAVCPRGCSAIPITRRCPPRISRRLCPVRFGTLCGGGRAQTRRSSRALPLCGSVRLIATTCGMSLGLRSGSWSSGPTGRRSRRSTGSQPCRRTPRSRTSLSKPNSAGVLSGTIRSSNRRSGWGITRDGAGAGFITTRPCASQLTDSWSVRKAGFPPQAHPPRSSKHLLYPTVATPAALPTRPERPVADSIATLRIRLARALAKLLPRCPCCHRMFMTQ